MTTPTVVSEQARIGDLDRPVGFFRPHALAVLEFPRVLDVVAGYAHAELGAARVRLADARGKPTPADLAAPVLCKLTGLDHGGLSRVYPERLLAAAGLDPLRLPT